MKNQINISNLTPEQIEEFRQQLKAFDEQPKTIMDKVKRWEDAAEIINPRFWIDIYGKIENGDVDPYKNHVTSEKHAKSILATCQLMVIAEALNEGWKPDCNNNENKFFIDYSNFGLGVNYGSGYFHRQILFKSKELAKYTITQFPELWYDYFMIDKPE